jgi:hypothetical protein
MRIVGLIGAIWFAVSIPVALGLGQVLKRHSAQYPTSDELEERAALRVVEDQR